MPGKKALLIANAREGTAARSAMTAVPLIGESAGRYGLFRHELYFIACGARPSSLRSRRPFPLRVQASRSSPDPRVPLVQTFRSHLAMHGGRAEVIQDWQATRRRR